MKFNFSSFFVDIENNHLILCQFGYFLSRIPFLRYLTSTFRGFDLDLWILIFDLQKSSEVKNIPDIRDPTQDFLSDFCWHFPSISYRFWDIQNQIKVWPWSLTFIVHLGLKIFSPFESPYMTSYLISIDTFSLSRTVFKIFDFEVLRVWPWPLIFEGHLGSKKFLLFESSNLTSYLTSIDTFDLSHTVLEIFDFKVFRVWPWTLAFRSHLRSYIFSPFESPHMSFYIISIETFSLSRTVFEIFDFSVFGVWPRSLTFRGHLRSKIISLFESPYMISYLIYLYTFSISCTVLEIFDVLFNIYWHFLSISYRFRDIRHQSF